MTSRSIFARARVGVQRATLTALGLAALTLAGCGKEQSDQRVPELAPERLPPAEAIKLGAVWSRSGPGSSYAAEQPAGAQLAVDEVNRTRFLEHPLELLTRDDHSEAGRASRAFAELADKERVAALIGPTL